VSREAVDTIISATTDSLARAEKASLVALGFFSSEEEKRLILKTRKAIQIPVKKMPQFRPGSDVRQCDLKEVKNMKEKTINRKWQKLKYFGGGVGVGFFLLGLTLSTGAKNIPETPTPSGPTKPSQGQSSPAPEVQLKIEGEVRDIFDNPRKDVIVMIKEIDTQSVTDEKGRFLFSNVPDREDMILEAHHGEELCSRGFEISEDTKVIEEVRADNVTRKTVKINEPLTLENPNIKVEACLCEGVEDRMPINRFEEEKPRIPVDIGTIWCFVRVFGPPGYEKGKKTEITYLWYFNGELVHSYTQDVGFNLAPRGWRTWAFKNLHGRTGRWKLEIVAKHKQLVSLSFETY
jgi:nucleoid DNA-binding protein